jgi:hypothetical protein
MHTPHAKIQERRMATDNILVNSIVGELIACEKYQFIDGRLVAAIVNDVVDIIKAKTND